MSEPLKIVIVGSGFAGTALAERLDFYKRLGVQLDITLISKTNYQLLTPLLFEVISGTIKPENLCNSLDSKLDNIRLIQGEVVTIDAQNKKVELLDQENVQYDYLILAAGTGKSTDALPGADWALSFKTLDDAIVLKNRLQQLTYTAKPKIVIVGAGYVGIELACEIAGYLSLKGGPKPQITLLDSSSIPLGNIAPAMVDPIRQRLEQLGIALWSNAKAIECSSDQVELADGRILQSDLLIRATGGTPPRFLSTLKTEMTPNGRLKTDHFGQVSATQNIWALGDCAAIPKANGHLMPALAQHALIEAEFVALNILLKSFQLPMLPIQYDGLGEMASLGPYQAIGQISGFQLNGVLAWALRRSYYWWRLPSPQNRVGIAQDWLISLLKDPLVLLKQEVGSVRPLLPF
jgi:NADH:ubiquinone reductase (H+-translocating)